MCIYLQHYGAGTFQSACYLQVVVLSSCSCSCCRCCCCFCCCCCCCGCCWGWCSWRNTNNCWCCGLCLGVGRVCDSLRLWLWLQWTGEHKQSHEAKKPVKLCKAKKKETGETIKAKKAEKQTTELVRYASTIIFSAFCDANLHCGDRTSHFAWHLRHWKIDPFMLHDICSMFELQPSMLHGGFPFWLMFEALWNLNFFTSSFTSWSLDQRKETKTRAKTKAHNNKIETAGGGHGCRCSCSWFSCNSCCSCFVCCSRCSFCICCSCCLCCWFCSSCSCSCTCNQAEQQRKSSKRETKKNREAEKQRSKNNREANNRKTERQKSRKATQ